MISSSSFVVVVLFCLFVVKQNFPYLVAQPFWLTESQNTISVIKVFLESLSCVLHYMNTDGKQPCYETTMKISQEADVFIGFNKRLGSLLW